MKKILIGLASALMAVQSLAAGGGEWFPNHPFTPDLSDQGSLQRGAKYFVNYCSGCHSLQYQRYNRTFRDLGIDPEIGAKNLILTGAKPVDQMHNAMVDSEGLKWFGQTPPDLSLTERARGRGYIYNYLQSFYLDESRPLGFNNVVFPGASMPNPLWDLEGLRTPTYHEETTCHRNEEGKKDCETHRTINGFEIVQAGKLSPQEYKEVVYDIANFLSYVSDPSAIDRKRIGPWVLTFIFFLTVMFYLLKKEYWRDIKFKTNPDKPHLGQAE